VTCEQAFHTPAIVQVICSPVMLPFSDRSCAVWDETVHRASVYFMFQKCSHFIKAL
jgi:hypothetical protein